MHALKHSCAAAFAVVLLLMASGCGEKNTTTPEPTDTSVRAQLEYTIPVSVTEAFRAAWQARLDVTEIRHTFYVGDTPFRGFLRVEPGQTAEEIQANLGMSYETFLSDQLRSFAEKSVTGSLGVDVQTSYAAFQEDFQQALRRAPVTELPVDGLSVSGSHQAVESLCSTAQGVLEVTLESSPRTREPTGLPQGATEALSDPATWTPRGGTIAVLPSGYAGCRYVSQEMYWTNVSGFVWNSTYEHDFFLNHSPGPPYGTYLDRSQYTQWNYRGIPIVEYATSSLPRAYLDTRYGDPSYMIAYTIGAADADAIHANTWYSSYIRVRNGDRNTDNAKLAAQRGRRVPPNDYTTWGSYSIEQVDIFPAWSIAIPCGFSWQR